MNTTDDTSAAGSQTPEGWAPGTWTIDPAHTTVSFSARHLMSRVRGTFNDVSGQIVTDPDPARSSVTAVIGTASLNTGNQMRDDHLRSADFFDVERYPQMRFDSRTLRRAAGSWVLSGELTIRDVTRPVDLEVDFLGSDPTGLQGEPRIGFSAQTTVSRRDFGITFGLVADGTKIIIADKVDIALDVQAFQTS
ncbi:YceI family protein [Actinomadura opuntiae]|uniref:YceI family protein n=1 Tax=Actinomadura sp. OS1-43 TaxID=604315 RepID=UPI00255AD602|nr:YceI family protein [Actinomadura sp. OS1-43]MDL4817172.1 YceI family protein [Actinomadura sp. OS1-43]